MRTPLRQFSVEAVTRGLDADRVSENLLQFDSHDQVSVAGRTPSHPFPVKMWVFAGVSHRSGAGSMTSGKTQTFPDSETWKAASRLRVEVTIPLEQCGQDRR